MVCPKSKDLILSQRHEGGGSEGTLRQHSEYFLQPKNTHEYINSMGASQTCHYAQECRKCVKTVHITLEIQVNTKSQTALPSPNTQSMNSFAVIIKA